jgi:hypothetical protein
MDKHARSYANDDIYAQYLVCKNEFSLPKLGHYVCDVNVGGEFEAGMLTIVDYAKISTAAMTIIILEDFPSISLNLIDGSVLVDCYDDLLARN